MTRVADLAAWSLFAFAVLLFAAQVLAREIGYRIGRRYASTRAAQADGIGIVVTSILGLLAFVLALTLSFASTRFDERRAGTLAEANAIGTAWLRAEAIGGPRALAIARLLRAYAVVRADFIRAPRDAAAIAALNQRTQDLQNEIWGHMAALLRDRQDPVAAGFMAAVNDVFDTATQERFFYEFSVPAPLFWLLLAMALIGMTALGVQLGLKGRQPRALAILLTILWTLVLVDILDLAAARVGEVRTSALVYDWTIQGMAGDVVIPPPPAAPVP